MGNSFYILEVKNIYKLLSLTELYQELAIMTDVTLKK